MRFAVRCRCRVSGGDDRRRSRVYQEYLVARRKTHRDDERPRERERERHGGAAWRTDGRPIVKRLDQHPSGPLYKRPPEKKPRKKERKREREREPKSTRPLRVFRERATAICFSTENTHTHLYFTSERAHTHTHAHVLLHTRRPTHTH